MKFEFIPGVSEHARERAVQRIGCDPPREHWLAAVRSILDRTALLMAAGCRNGCERWRVAIGTVEVDVFWSPAAGMIASLIEAGKPALNPVRTAHRNAISRGRSATQPYHRARTQREDWR